jgi:hypothetical protein
VSNSARRRPLSRLERADGGPRAHRPHRRTIFAFQRQRWAYEMMLAEIERMEQEETAVKVADDAGFTFDE